jgi:hypothetical protein
VFDKGARWFFPGQDVQGVVAQVGGALYHRGISLAPSGPMRWTAVGTSAGLGFVPKVWISVLQDQGGFWLDVRLRGDLDPGSVVLLVLSWTFCFPLGALLLYTKHQAWVQHADNMMLSMQQPVAHLQSTPAWGQVAWSAPR